jgi:EmrB/QacA subfamily drug resistance transporter
MAEDMTSESSSRDSVASVETVHSQRTVTLILAGLLAGLVLGFMDVTIVSTAGPTIVSELGGLSLYAWVFSAFLIVQTVTIPIFGKLSDLYGRKRLFLLGIVVFMAGSVLSGASRSIYELILFRAVQGLGFGAFVPTTIAIAGDMFPPERRGRVQGLLFSVNGIAFAIAPAVGSFLTETISWRWIFYINLPVGVVSLVLIMASLKESRAANASAFSDWLGTSTLVGFLGVLMLGLFLGGSTFAWSSWAEVSLFAGSALLFLGFVIAERRAREPVLPPRLFRIRNVSAATAVNLLRAVVFFAIIAYVPLFAAAVLGGSVGDVRNVIYGFTLPLTGGILVSGTAISKLGFRKLALIGAAIVSVGLLPLTLVRPAPSLVQLIVIGIPLGFGNGMMIPATIVAFQNSVQKGEIGIASGLATFTLNLGGAIGVSILGAIQASIFASTQSALLAITPSGGAAIVREAFSQSILVLFWIILGVSVATLATTLSMEQRRAERKTVKPGTI